MCPMHDDRPCLRAVLPMRTAGFKPRVGYVDFHLEPSLYLQ